MACPKPILTTCCCWRSLKIGSNVAGLYSLIYFLVTISMMSHFVYEERRFLSGIDPLPTSTTFLEPTVVSKPTVALNIVILTTGIIGVPSTLLLFLGIRIKCRYMLFPWIVTMCFDTAVEFVHLGFMIYFQTFNFNPVTAVIFTLDFFVVVLHIYAILCVISLYQEFLMEFPAASNEFRMNDLNEAIFRENFPIHHGRPQSINPIRLINDIPPNNGTSTSVIDSPITMFRCGNTKVDFKNVDLVKDSITGRKKD